MTLFLRLNLGDASEDRIYYLPHLIALSQDFFTKHGLEVALMRSAEGGNTIMGGQIPPLLTGEADLAIGGAMVTMHLAEKGTHLVNFCAAVRNNPWVILGRQPEADFSLERLEGQTVVDIANVGTAGFIFDAVMSEHKITASRSRGDDGIAGFLLSNQSYGIHHIHAAASFVASGEVSVLANMSDFTAGVPWSCYIATPERLAQAPEAFSAFRKAISDALVLLNRLPAAEIATMVSPYFSDLPLQVLQTSIQMCQSAQLWPMDIDIPLEDFDRFGALLQLSGWLTAKPDHQHLTNWEQGND